MRAFMVNSSPSSAQTSPSNPGENQGNILTFQTCRQARTANFFDTDRGPMRISSYVSMRYVATVEEILRSDLSSTVDDGASAWLSQSLVNIFAILRGNVLFFTVDCLASRSTRSRPMEPIEIKAYQERISLVS
jgi:hypothetical protein